MKIRSLFAMLLAAVAVAANAQTGRIAGKVIDAQTS